MDRRRSLLSKHWVCPAALVLCSIGGWSCAKIEFIPSAKSEVTAASFTDPASVAVPAPATTAKQPDAPTVPAIDTEPTPANDTMRAGRRWVVDALIGQINGRPLYAGEFLETIEDRILRLVAEQPDERARVMAAQIVSERLAQYVNTELIIAEAGATLSPEMKQGLLAFLQDLRERTVAGFGGTRQGAESTVRDLYGMTLDEYVVERKNEAMARELLRKRVEPRVIVSWRDVEIEYARRQAEFSPAGRIVVGRISLRADDPRAEEITQRLGNAESFPAVAAELGTENGGVWKQFDFPAEGIAGLGLAEDIRSSLGAVPQGQASAPIKRATMIQWYCVLDMQSAQTRTIWDPTVQEELRFEISNKRSIREQDRYLLSLRDRWITNDFDDMRRRLISIAIQRYFPE
ncbi:MAG: hypothetical protein O2800_01890 [Planctomycetota bacterium]|nr:hypothetical protein [Planctomycetota bacterium]